MRKSTYPKIDKKKCKGCDVIMTKDPHYDSYRFRMKKFHSVDCRKAYDIKHGGYGRGDLL